jgi:hypothetical protein
VLVMMRSPLSVKPLLISPITSPSLLRICISTLRDQVLSEQLVNLSELLPDVELRVTRDAVLLDEVGQSAVRKLRPAPSVNQFSTTGTRGPSPHTLVLEERGFRPRNEKVLTCINLGRRKLHISRPGNGSSI